MEVLPVLDMIDLRDEFFHQRVISVELFEGCADTRLQIIIGFLNLADVRRLKLREGKEENCVSRRIFGKIFSTYIDHLSEPGLHDGTLVRCESFQLAEECLLPHDLRVLKHPVDKLCTVGGRVGGTEELTGEGRAKVELEGGGELGQEALYHLSWLTLLQ